MDSTSWVDDLWGSQSSAATATPPTEASDDHSWVNDLWGAPSPPTNQADSSAVPTPPPEAAPAPPQPVAEPVDEYHARLDAMAQQMGITDDEQTPQLPSGPPRPEVQAMVGTIPPDQSTATPQNPPSQPPTQQTAVPTGTPNSTYAYALQQNEALKAQLRAQGVPEKDLDAAIYHHNMQQAAADDEANRPDSAFKSFEDSYLARLSSGAAQNLSTGMAGLISRGYAWVTGDNSPRERIADISRAQSARDEYLNAGSTAKRVVQEGVNMIAGALPAAETGLGGMALYFGLTSADKTLTDAQQRGDSPGSAYSQAAAHGTIDAAWAIAGGKLGSGLAKLAGSESEGALSKATSWVASKIKLPQWTAAMTEGAAGQAAQAVGMSASHYMADVALGKREFDRNDLISQMEGSVPAAIIAGAGGAAVHQLIHDYADTIDHRNELLPTATKAAADAADFEGEPPSTSPGSFARTTGIKKTSKLYREAFKDAVENRDTPLPTESAAEPQQSPQEPTAESSSEQPQPEAEVSQAPDETPPQQPPVVSDSSPEPPAASNTTTEGDLSQGEEGGGAPTQNERGGQEEVAPWPNPKTYADFEKWHDSLQSQIDDRVDAHIKAGDSLSQAYERQDVKPLQDHASASLDAVMRHLGAKVADDISPLWNKWRPSVAYPDSKTLGDAPKVHDESALQWFLREHLGVPNEKSIAPNSIFISEGKLANRAKAVEAMARDIHTTWTKANGLDSEGVLGPASGFGSEGRQRLVGDAKSLAEKIYNRVAERLSNKALDVSGIKKSDIARESERSQLLRDKLFALSREASPNTSPISEPFSVPESQRLPAQTPAERQPALEGMPTDMEPGTLAGQKGLFNQHEQAGQVLGFGGGTKVAPLVAGTKEQLSALVRTHTPGLDIVSGAKKAKEGLASLLLPTMNGPEYLHAAEQLGAELGAKNRRGEAAAHALKNHGTMFDRLGVDRAGIDPERNPGIQFMSAMSTGKEVSGKFRKAADVVSKLFGDRLQKLAEAGAPLQQVRDNYFPGMFTAESRKAFSAAIGEAIEKGILPENFDPNNVADEQRAWVKSRVDEHLANGTGSDKDALQYLTRQPMAGKESFRKQKVFDDILTATQFGLRPVSNNPIDLVKLKLAEIDQSIAFHSYVNNRLKPEGKLQQIDPYQQIPDGMVKINDKYGTVYGPPTVEVSEHLDKAVYDGLLDVAGKLGISHERLMDLPRRNALGLSYQGGNKIQSKFGTETSVIAHEIGHQLDYRYNLWDNILRRDDGRGFKPGRSELRDIADLTERGQKARSKEEKIAQVLEAYVHAPEKMKEVAPRVFDWFDSFIKSKPELAPLAEIKPGLALKKLTSEKYVGLPIVGYRIVPKAEGAIINNYLSSSLYNNPYFGGMYKAWMGTANALNQTQLGVGSAFHAGFTTGEAQISSNANVLKDVYGVLRGNRSLEDLKGSLGKSATATVRTFMLGDKVLNAWRNPDGVIDPKVAQIVKAIELAGGGFKLETGLQTEQTTKMARDWYSGKRLSAAVRSPVSAIELMAKPIMEGMVPRQKAGVVTDLIGRIIEQNPDKSLEELTPEFRQAWNRVDARLGQARYNRLFTNNAAKNVIQGLIRAPGWSGGTIAEIGGAFPDAAKFVGEWVKTGKPPQELPDRVAYSLALIGSVAVANGALTYAFTGQKPTGLDYFAFRDGNKDENGKETRLLLPTYVKDLLAYWRDPKQTLVNKTHPLISLVSELANNRDYYGTQIRNPSDSVGKQAGEAGAYVAKAFIPFWLRGAEKVREQGGGAKELALPYVGIMPAPKHVTETPAERAARQFIQQRTPTTRTQEDAAKAQERAQIKTALRRGDKQPLADAVASGNVSRRNVSDIRKSAARPPLVNMVKPLSADEALTVWSKADDDERAIVKATIVVKLRNALKSASPSARKELILRARAAGVLSQPATAGR
jgi:hypothetical protein